MKSTIKLDRSKKYIMFLNRFSRSRIVITFIYLIILVFVFSVIKQPWPYSDISNGKATKDVKYTEKIHYDDHGLSVLIAPLDHTEVPEKRSIFFIQPNTEQTACITIRQACSIESAARINPDRMVFILLLSPILLIQNDLMAVISLLTNYENVRLRYIDFFTYIDNTPLQSFVQSGAMHSSIYPVEHRSELLRALTLWKFGGIYMDLDMISLKPIPLINFFSADPNDTILNNGVLGIQSKAVAERIIHMFVSGWNGKVWNHDWAQLLTKMMKDLCSVDEVSKMLNSPTKCKNITIFSSEVYFPLSYFDWECLFNSSKRDFIQDTINNQNSWTLYLWNSISVSEIAVLNTDMPYEDIAEEFCPNVYDTIIDEF